jgi:hypothetical protein
MPNASKLAIGFAAVALPFCCQASGTAANASGMALDGGPLPAATQPAPPLITPFACDWSPGDGTPTSTTPAGAMRWGWVDLAAGYWQIALGVSFPVGTHFRIDAQYPEARNFSWQLYDGQSQSVAYLPDYLIEPDPGSRSQFTGVNSVDTAIAPLGQYTLQVIFGAQPAKPPPNTIYVDASQFTIGSPPIFVYRIYNAYAGISVAEHGGVPLPSVVEETAQGDVALASIQTPLRCDLGFGGRFLRPTAAAESHCRHPGSRRSGFHPVSEQRQHRLFRQFRNALPVRGFLADRGGPVSDAGAGAQLRHPERRRSQSAAAPLVDLPELLVHL